MNELNLCKEMLDTLNEVARDVNTIHGLHAQYDFSCNSVVGVPYTGGNPNMLIHYAITIRYKETGTTSSLLHTAKSSGELLGYLTCLRDTLIELGISSDLQQELKTTSVNGQHLF